jgi:hypothetical protein
VVLVAVAAMGDSRRGALPLEQHVQAPIAEAATFLGDRPKSAGGDRHRPPGSPCTSWSCGAADGFTRPPFAHPMGIHEMRDSLPLGRGRHHFFPRRSFKAALSSMASAKNRFSRVFSSFTGFKKAALA